MISWTKVNESARSFKGWCVVSPFGRPWIMGFDTTRTRKDAIKTFCDGSGLAWKVALRRGFRVIKVTVSSGWF